MKKNLIYAVILLLGFTACRKTEVENVFYASPEKRMQDTLEFIRKELLNSPYGWKGGLNTGLKGGFGFYVNFDAEQNVAMLSDYSTAAGTDVKQSTYRVSATNTAVLLFDTYNYISILQDPVPSVAGGTAGQGYRSDVEFIYTGHRGDSLFFKGKKYEHPFTLIKISQAEQQAYLAGSLNSYKTDFVNAFNSNYTSAYYNDGSNDNLAVEIDYSAKNVRFVTANSTTGEATGVYTSPFYYTATELSLVREYYAPYNGKAIKALKYEGNNILLVFTDGSTGVLSTQIVPVYKFDFAFDYNKLFSRIVGGDPIPGVTATVHIFDQVNTLFTNSGRTITDQYFRIRNNVTAVYYIAYDGTAPDYTKFTAQATYEITKRTGDRIWLKRTATDANFDTRATQVAPINTFFGTGVEREFVLDWVTSSNASVKIPIGAIKSATNTNNMLYGRITP